MKKNLTINWWKWACLLLLALNLAFVAVIASRLIQVRETESQQLVQSKVKKVKVGTIISNRQQINDTVASFLQSYQSKEFNYKLYTSSSSIVFEGKYKLLGYEVPLYIYFQPSSLENGAIQLEVTSFSAGTLPLPEREVLQYLKSTYKLPDFVTVSPKKSLLVVNLQSIENQQGLYLESKKIDLVNNEISFDIFKKSQK